MSNVWVLTVPRPGCARVKAFWNGVGLMEKRQDAHLARELYLVLPLQLDAAKRPDLVRSFVTEQFDSWGMVAYMALHEPVGRRGDDACNPHAHIMLTLRQATETGLSPVNTREWNSESLLQAWRVDWGEAQTAL